MAWWRVGRVEAVQDDLARVGLVVAVGVLEEHQVRLLARRRRRRRRARCRWARSSPSAKTVCLSALPSPLVSSRISILSFGGLAGQVLRVRRHRASPTAGPWRRTSSHRLLQVGELVLRGEQVDLVAFGELEVLVASSASFAVSDFLAVDEPAFGCRGPDRFGGHDSVRVVFQPAE